MSAPHLAFLAGLDWNTPTGRTAEGQAYWTIRCRVPFTVPMQSSARSVEGGTIQLSANAVQLDVEASARTSFVDPPERVIDDDGEGILLDPTATGEPGTADEEAFGRQLVAGIASSTSVDFYGTEMSLRALKMMAGQMIVGGGIPYLPRHNRGMSGPIEWDEIIGRTVHAEVIPVDGDQVRAPHNESETHFLLRATMEIIPIPEVVADRDASEIAAASLLKRVKRGEIIGQSIGGWFTQLQILQNEDGDVERVIVQGVDLDHLAVTRAPANPDANAITQLRTAIERSAYEVRAKRMIEHLGNGTRVFTTPAVAERVRDILTERVAEGEADEGFLAVVTDDSGVAMQFGERHVVAAEVTPNTVIYQYLKGGRTVDDLEPGELVGDDPGADESLSKEAEEGDYDAPIGAKADKDGDDVPAARAEPESEGEIYNTYEQIEAACARSEVRDGRVIVSWDADAPEEAVAEAVLAAATGSLGPAVQDALKHTVTPAPEATSVPADSRESAESATIGVDARRSAPPDPSSPIANQGDSSEEHAMPVNEETLAAFRSLLDAALAPMLTDIAALKASGTADPAPADRAAPTQVAEARNQAAAAVARAKASEDALAAMCARPNRVGRSALAIPDGPAAQGAYDTLIGRARTDAPALAAVAQQLVPELTTRTGLAGEQRVRLEQGLHALLVAAEHDGIITDPNERATWQ
ncbi:MAG: hypothetical protein HRU00_17060 [Myxococcales bacterium]|nr:hypothetical protein [Myxococcales bacterium]